MKNTEEIERCKHIVTAYRAEAEIDASNGRHKRAQWYRNQADHLEWLEKMLKSKTK